MLGISLSLGLGLVLEVGVKAQVRIRTTLRISFRVEIIFSNRLVAKPGLSYDPAVLFLFPLVDVAGSIGTLDTNNMPALFPFHRRWSYIFSLSPIFKFASID